MWTRSKTLEWKSRNLYINPIIVLLSSSLTEVFMGHSEFASVLNGFIEPSISKQLNQESRLAFANHSQGVNDSVC